MTIAGNKALVRRFFDEINKLKLPSTSSLPPIALIITPHHSLIWHQACKAANRPS